MIELLDRELAALGVPARRRRRIRLELEDHLSCDPSADLGDPTMLARQFADELGTAYARRAAFVAFLALVPLGVLFVVLFGFTAVYTTDVEPAVTLALVAGTQLAFVGGALALLRAWRMRRARVISASEARVLLRRSALGLGGGAVTVGAIAFVAPGEWLGVEWSAPALAGITVCGGAVGLAAGGVALVRALRLLPVAGGEPADLSFDLGSSVGPWRLAVAIAACVVVCIAAAGVVQSDPIDGLVRAFGDGTLCLVGFALLGRPLGLRA